MNEVVLSIVIVTYKCYELLDGCLYSIFQHNDLGTGLEVIVVDNAPNKDEINKLKKKYSEVSIIESDNKGFGAGNNLGASISKGKYILFLNPDTLIDSNLFNTIVQRLEANNKIGMAGCRLVKDNHQVISINFRKRFGIIKHLLFKIVTALNIFVPGAMYSSGADMFIRHKSFDEIGGFDESIFMYSEELDIIERLNRAGYNGVYFSDFNIVHLEGGSSGEIKSSRFEKALNSYVYVMNKHSYDFCTECKREIRFLKIKKLFVSDKKEINKCIQLLQNQLIS